MFLPGKSFCAALLLGEPRDYPVSVTYALKGFFRSRGWSWGMDCGASAPRQHVVPPLGATDSQRLFLLCQPWLTVTCCFPGAPVPTFGQSTPVPGAVGSGSSTLSFRTPSTPASSFGGVGTSFGKEGVGASALGSSWVMVSPWAGGSGRARCALGDGSGGTCWTLGDAKPSVPPRVRITLIPKLQRPEQPFCFQVRPPPPSPSGQDLRQALANGFRHGGSTPAKSNPGAAGLRWPTCGGLWAGAVPMVGPGPVPGTHRRPCWDGINQTRYLNSSRAKAGQISVHIRSVLSLNLFCHV